MPISTDMIVRIAHADIAMHRAFPASISHWQRKVTLDDSWKTYAGDCDAILIGKGDGVVIDGNCSGRVSAPDGGTIHIYGDLKSRIDIHGHYEIVVTGDVCCDAEINASGSCHIFIGGRFSGTLHSTDSAKIWIGSDFEGSIRTGMPSTRLSVGGNYSGSVSPYEDAGLLSLTVAGFARNALLSKIGECGYTLFHASIAESDVPAGLYPTTGYHLKTQRGNSYNRWCVVAESIR